MAISVHFFFNDTATTEIYTLSLHDALPICGVTQPAADCDISPAWADRGALVVLVAGLRRDAVRVGVAGRLGTLPGQGQGLVRGAGPGDQLLHVLRAFWQGVADEGQRRGVPQPGLAPDLRPDEPGGALQRGRGARLLVRRAVHGVVDRRLAQVTGELGVGDRHEAQPGILDPALQHLGHDLGDPVRKLVRPASVYHCASLRVDRRF